MKQNQSKEPGAVVGRRSVLGYSIGVALLGVGCSKGCGGATGTNQGSTSASAVGSMASPADSAADDPTELDGKELEFGVGAFEARATEVVLWTRTNGEAEVHFEYSKKASFRGALKTPKVLTTSDTDFVHTVALEKLKPGTRYYYRAVVNTAKGKEVCVGQFVTAPETNEAVKIVWSADLEANHKPFKILEAIAKLKPDLVLLLGDTAYCDHPKSAPAKSLSEYRAKHRENRESPELQALLKTTSVSAIWDDHEVENNFDRRHKLLPVGRQAYLEYWPGPVNSRPEVMYRSFRWGPLVEIFQLDGRTFRDPDTKKDGPKKTLIGRDQKAWLLSALKQSTARYKLLVTAVPFLVPFAMDSWFGYSFERDEIKTFIKEQKIEGVIILSADFHMAWELTDPVTGMREFIAGPLSSYHFDQIKKSKLEEVKQKGGFSMVNAVNFGMIELIPQGDDARVTVTIHDVKGKVKFSTMLSGTGP